jgi:hypothetical protein
VDVLWEKEPNDRAPEQANGALISDLTYFGSFANDSDINDYFYFDLLAPARVELWLRNIPEGHNFDLVLRDNALNAVGYSGRLGNADEQIIAPSPEAGSTLPEGRYFVQVFHRSTGGSPQPYHLQVTY